MKLKNVLVLAFLFLTLIPVIIVSFLLYNSGFSLSKESYSRNLVESINVQADYISQSIESKMISDYRFAKKCYVQYSGTDTSEETMHGNLLESFQIYLETSEDKIAVCILLNENNIPVYTIGEKAMLDTISAQLPKLSELNSQTIHEFDLGQGTYSLGIITPIWDENQTYAGSLVSVYDKSYIFKIISSYYKIADTTTYLCRENSDITNFMGKSSQKDGYAFAQALNALTLDGESMIDMRVGNTPVLGYYKNIYNSPWYLVGFIDREKVYSFTNQFLLVYILIIVGVLIADVLLAFYFSSKVVEPIHILIKIMDGYQNNLNNNSLQSSAKKGYFETQYLQSKFFSLMKTILLVQHNFEGVYRLYQSGAIDDTNVDIDVKNQTIRSNRNTFEDLMLHMDLHEDDCIVERFTKCFCIKDQALLTEMFENMRDEHLAVTREAEIYTPYLNEKWFHVLVVPMYEDDRLSRLFIQLRDISSFKKQEFESSEKVRRDALTKLYNRIGFSEHTNKALQAGRAADIHGLLFIDMNYFKMVNDNFGHSAGDDLLCAVSKVLLDTIGADDIASRFGGDEFAVFFPQTTPQQLEKIKKLLFQRLRYQFSTNEISFEVSASIGVSICEHTASVSIEQMLQQADVDMYDMKREMKQR